MKKHHQLSVIRDLVKPTTHNLDGANTTLSDALEKNLELVIQKYSINTENLKYFGPNDDPCWKFVCLSLSLLEELKEGICTAEKIEDELISLSERKEILSCMEFVISLGLKPYLLPGVGIPSPSDLQRAEFLKHLQTLNHLQKYERLCITVRSLLLLKDEFIFQSVLIPKFFNDLLAALFQLCFTPLKRPDDNASSVNSEDAMTLDLWNKLQIDRQDFRQKLEFILKSSHQSSLIKEIMVIQGSKACPKWLKLACSKLLSERLKQPGGLRATVTALCDSDFDSPTTWKKLDVITRIILSPDINCADDYYDKIVTQLLDILHCSESNDNKFESVMKEVSVRCIKLITEAPNVPEKRQLLKFIMRPLLFPSASIQETEITICISDLLTCCTLSRNEMFRVSPKLLTPIVYRLFLLLVKLNTSPSSLKNDVKNLIYCIFCDLQEDETLYGVLFVCLFNDISFCHQVLPLNSHKFELGDSGRVCFKEGYNKVLTDETSSIIIDLFIEKDSERVTLKKVFVKLLTIVAENDPVVHDFERYLIVIKTLSTLSSDEKIQKIINEEPKLIVDFVKSLLSGTLDDSVEIICLGLMILDVILSNVTHSSLRQDSSYFKTLIKPLSKTLETTKNDEIRSLVERILKLLKEQTSGSRKEPSKSSADLVPIKDGNTKQLSFQEAMHDVCDALLPVRAHGMMHLTKLIRAKDQEALAKKDVLFCLFKENLKHEDSYLYLSAADGLASLAAELPNSVLVTLIDEYSSNENPELRLKVGETLVKCTRMLGELVPTYKTELLNAFLSGTRDLDPLVRASSLSNLGEVCQLLGFRIGSIIVEILECVSNIISSDKDPEPRRAAVMVITMLLKGLQNDLFQVLEKQLLSLYRALKQIYVNEQDDIVKLHAQLAIEELNRITKDFFFPQQILPEKIQTLDIT
nr:PREDICTED: transport and Golgi organization protein 6 homolog [Bemisia tabaci]